MTIVPELTRQIGLHVEPFHLTRARKNVRSSRHAVSAATLDTVKVLREQLVAGDTPDPTRWGRRELRACSYLLADQEVGPAAVGLLLQVRERLQDRQVASVLAYAPRHAEVLQEARARATRPDRTAPTWFRSLPPHALTDAPALTRAILQATQVPDGSIEDVAEATKLSADAPLTRLVLEAWVNTATPRVLRQHADVHLAWSKTHKHSGTIALLLRDRTLEALAEHIVSPNELRQEGQVIAILEDLRDRYGGWATNPARTHRWEQHSERTRQLAHWWRISQELENFFSRLRGDPDRLRYWRRWIQHITDVRHFDTVQAFMVRIDDLYIVEFGRVGNAAYAYTRDAWLRINPVHVTHVDELKFIRMKAFRIIHKFGWQQTTDDEIIRHTGLQPLGDP